VVIPLASGAEARATGPIDERAVVCVNGGSGRELPGDWSATLGWLIRQLSPQLPELRFLEVRYRVKSWRRLDWCVEDCEAALTVAVAAGARKCALVGFSMGGAVSIAAAGHPAVSTVIGLAPWIPEQLDVSPLDGRRLAVVHGSLDGRLPGVPGVSPRQTKQGVDRIRARGVDVRHTMLSGAFHGVAVRAPWGTLLPLPRARRWTELVGAELEQFAARSRPRRAAAGSGGAPAASRSDA
jgi:dienelactone hydrolase